MRTIVTDDHWRFTIFDSEDSGEMFHLLEDPNEMNNLFLDPNASEKKMELFLTMTKAYMKPTQIPQYRNLPIINECKYLVDPNSDMHPTYTING